MDEAINWLRQLGFGEYESKTYVGLLLHGPQSGYELARSSGVPRPNIYAVLEKLEERGAVMREDSADGTRYVAVPHQELLEGLTTRFQSALGGAQDALRYMDRPLDVQSVWNIRGREAVLAQARSLLAASRSRTLIAIRRSEAQELSQELRALRDGDSEVTTLCMDGCPQECGACQGTVYRIPVATETDTQRLVVVTDGAEMLTAEFSRSGDAYGVRTRQSFLVDMATWYVHQTIFTASLLTGTAKRATTEIGARVTAMIGRSGSTRKEAGWFDFLRRLLSRD